MYARVRTELNTGTLSQNSTVSGTRPFFSMRPTYLGSCTSVLDEVHEKIIAVVNPLKWIAQWFNPLLLPTQKTRQP